MLIIELCLMALVGCFVGWWAVAAILGVMVLSVVGEE